MRVMVGLTAPTSGSATIDGVRFADLPNPGLEVGVLLDASAQHAGRTGREILTIASETMGLPRTRVDEMLELVSLTPTEAKRRVRDYSLGMRQRLGIATALLGDPRVLILDEPANGLDPAGIRWMRDLLTGFASQGGTVLLSSHLLHEIEVIADDLVVIGNGMIVASGSKEELLAAAGTLATVDVTARSRTRTGAGRDRQHARRGRLGPHRRRPRSCGGRGPDRRHRPHRAPVRRRRRTRRHVPVAHCRHPTRRSCGMTATIVPPATTTEAAPVRRTARPIPTTRLVKVELRKMFNTRSGFWMLVSIGVLSVVAAGSVLVFAPDSDVTYESFARASGFPMSVILPMIAILAVTSEWSQRSGLTTFTLVPSRGRVIGAKAIATLLVGLGSVAVAFAVGALGNVAGSAIAGVDTVWDISLSMAPQMVLFNLVGMAIGFTLGVVLRNSAAAIVGYFVVSLVLPGILVLLAQVRSWFEDLQPWIDWNYTQVALLEGAMDSGEEWAMLGSTTDLDRRSPRRRAALPAPLRDQVVTHGRRYPELTCAFRIAVSSWSPKSVVAPSAHRLTTLSGPSRSGLGVLLRPVVPLPGGVHAEGVFAPQPHRVGCDPSSRAMLADREERERPDGDCPDQDPDKGWHDSPLGCVPPSLGGVHSRTMRFSWAPDRSSRMVCPSSTKPYPR